MLCAARRRAAGGGGATGVQQKMAAPADNNGVFGAANAVFVPATNVLSPAGYLTNGSTVFKWIINMNEVRSGITMHILQYQGANSFDVMHTQTGINHGGTGEELFNLAANYTIPASGNFLPALYHGDIQTMDYVSAANIWERFNSGDVSGTGNVLSAKTNRECASFGVEY